jgi:uncharacterized protein (DUF433 family)
VNVVTINPDVQGGVTCFAGSRVPISSLFEHLKKGYTVDEFLADFPTVSKAQVEALLDLAQAEVCKHAEAAAQYMKMVKP